MGDARDDIHDVVSQFADDWLSSDEWALLRGLPSMTQLVCLDAVSALRGSPEPLPCRLRRLADTLSPLSLLRRLVHDLASATESTGAAGVVNVVDDFVTNFLAPTQKVLHSFTLGAIRVTGISGSEPVQLVEDWKLHPRGMPLAGHASSLVNATQTNDPPTSLTRFADVPKGADLVRYRILSWLYAQLILEGLRLFALSGVFVAQEDFSPDFRYVGTSRWNPATCPTTRVFYAMPADRIPELAAFLSSWLPLSPSRESDPPKETGRNRLHQALRQLKRAYDDSDWESALVDAVSGLELLLLAGERDELSYRLAIRAGHLLFAHDPDRAGSVFADIRHMYDVRSTIAHGNREAAGKKAKKRWGAESRSCDQAGAVCATTAIDYLRRAILAAAYFESKGKDIQTEIEETSLLNAKNREVLRKSLEEDASNPLVRALTS
jgi:hypothetical protein